MASIFNPPPCVNLHCNPISLSSFPVVLSSSIHWTASLQLRVCALRAGSDGGIIGSKEPFDAELLRRPSNLSGKDMGGGSEDKEAGSEGRRNYKEKEEDERVDWEDRILQDTVPLVGFVRMILHSGKYESGDRLSPGHEKTILERLLPYHPEFEKKIGCGIDYITVGYHPDFEGSRCMFIVRKDGELVDFSYWKCIKGLIRKNYPLYADRFIFRHFRRRRSR